MKKGVNNWRIFLRVILFVILLYTFYRLGMPLHFIIIIGLFILLFMFLKGKLYSKLDHFLVEKFPFLSKQKPWVQRVIIVLSFILIYMILKQIIFFVLIQFGIDMQQIMTESINQSLNN